MGESWIPAETYPLDAALTRFAGLTVRDFVPADAVPPERGWLGRVFGPQRTARAGDPAIDRPDQHAYRIGIGVEHPPEDFAERVAALLADPACEELRALVVGNWFGDDPTSEPTAALTALSEAASHLTELRALFFGDVTGEENELTWIVQGDHGPLLRAFPRLEEYAVRGSQNLRFSPPLDLPVLRRLTVQGGELPGICVRDLAAADLPELRHLAIWLGPTFGITDDWSLDDLRPILAGTKRPRLESLALVNSTGTDGIAAAVAQAPILERLQALDMSLGTLGDVGGQALLASPAIRRLRRLDLHHHFMSKETMADFRTLGIDVDLSEANDADPDDRYCAVSE